MWLTDLADACRASGLPVAEETGWRTRGHGPMVAARGIICHHTAGPRAGNYPSLRVVRDGRPGLPGPLAHLGLARDGTVIVIAAGLAYHAGSGFRPGLSGNTDCIGIEAESVGDGTDWTPAQRAAWPRLCAALARRYGIPARNVIAHWEWAPGRKIDPAGVDMDQLRRSVDAAVLGSRIPDLEDDMTPEQYQTLLDIQSLLNEVAGSVGRAESNAYQALKALGAVRGDLTAALAAEGAQATPDQVEAAIRRVLGSLDQEVPQ